MVCCCTVKCNDAAVAHGLLVAMHVAIFTWVIFKDNSWLLLLRSLGSYFCHFWPQFLKFLKFSHRVKCKDLWAQTHHWNQTSLVETTNGSWISMKIIRLWAQCDEDQIRNLDLVYFNIFNLSESEETVGPWLSALTLVCCLPLGTTVQETMESDWHRFSLRSRVFLKSKWINKVTFLCC